MSRELTIEQAAERVGIGIRTLHRWFNDGLPRTRTPHLEGGRGHKVRVHIIEDDLLEFDRGITRARRDRQEADQRRLDALAAARRQREQASIAAQRERDATIWAAENPAIAFSRVGHRIEPGTGWCVCLSEPNT